MIKLGIGTPTSGLMEARTSYSLIAAILSTVVAKPMSVDPYLGLGCYIHVNRNMIVDMALNRECTHLLQVDSDLMFGPDAITKLISHEVDIVAARYNKRTLDASGNAQPTVKENITDLSPVPFVPSGFLLVNCEVFKKIGKPWFGFDERSDSDDLYFCNKAIDAGYKVYCDPTIHIGHLGTAVF